MSVLATGIESELELELTRARLLARRQIAWLRSSWPAAPGFSGLAVSHEEADYLTLPDRSAQLEEFLEEDPAAQAAAEELERAEARLAAMREDPDKFTPLAALAERLGLDPLERDLLALATGAELDPGVARLCAYLQDDATRPHLTIRLAGELLTPGADPLGTVTATLAARRKLRALGLLRLEGEGPWALRALRVSERVLAVLAGESWPERSFLAAIEPMAPAPLSARHGALVERTARLLAAAVTAGAPPVLALTGESSTPLHAVAAGVAARLGLEACRLWVERLGEPIAEAAATIEREAALGRMAFVLDEPLGDRWPALNALVIVIGREAPAYGVGLSVSVPAPTYDERRDALAAILAPEEIEAHQLERIASRFPLAPDAVEAAVAAARAEAREEGADLEDALWRACRARARRRARGLAYTIEPRRGWRDLVLPDPVSERLREMVAQVECRAVVYDRWGFGERLGRSRGITALFAGPSGTGKTLAAEVIAGALGIDLQRIDLAGVVDKYIGETEKHLREVFDAAEDSGALLFFDEADALFGERTEVRDSHDRYANIEVDYLLTRMEDYPGLAVLATNRKSALDQAFLRRLRFVLDFPFPDAASRRRIWEATIPPTVPTDGLDLDALGRLELAGGSIATVAVNAAFAAAAHDEPLQMEHIAAAARAELSKLERLVKASDLDAWLEQAR